MNYQEHFDAAERALEGAKKIMKGASELAPETPGLVVRIAQYNDSAGLLLSVASVHASLARACR